MENNNLIINTLRKMKFYLIGDIKELDNKVICYINEKNIGKYLEYDKNGNLLSFKNINIDKPIYYVLYDIDFLDYLTIKSEGNNNLLFENCIFKNPIYIKRVDGSITFSDNKYLNINNYSNDVPYLRGTKINKIIFEHEIFYNLKKTLSKHDFTIDIDAKEIEIDNSCIDIRNSSDCYFKCDNLKISNSVLRTNDLYFNANNIKYHNNYINAENIIINNQNHNINFNGILASFIILNDDIIVDETNKFANKTLIKK